MKKGLEIRLYPSKEQRVLIDRTLGCSRFVYNHVLALKKELWEDYKLSIIQSKFKILQRRMEILDESSITGISKFIHGLLDSI